MQVHRGLGPQLGDCPAATPALQCEGDLSPTSSPSATSCPLNHVFVVSEDVHRSSSITHRHLATSSYQGSLHMPSRIKLMITCLCVGWLERTRKLRQADLKGGVCSTAESAYRRVKTSMSPVSFFSPFFIGSHECKAEPQKTACVRKGHN